MLNISLVFRKYLCSSYAQQSNNFCLVLLSKAKKHFQKMAETRVNHTNENKNIP